MALQGVYFIHFTALLFHPTFSKPGYVLLRRLDGFLDFFRDNFRIPCPMPSRLPQIFPKPYTPQNLSFISISRRYLLLRSSKASGSQSSPNHFDPPSRLLRNSIVFPEGQKPPTHPSMQSWIGTTGMPVHYPAGSGSSSIAEPSSSHIVRCVQISTKSEPRGASALDMTKETSTSC